MNLCAIPNTPKAPALLKKFLMREKAGPHIFEPRVGAREAGGLSMHPRGVKIPR
jgi:hypothetical protein